MIFPDQKAAQILSEYFGLWLELIWPSANLPTADMVPADDRLSMLAQHAKGGNDITVVKRLRPALYTILDRSERGVEVCLKHLRRGGTDWWLHPTRDEVRHEYDRMWFGVRKSRDSFTRASSPTRVPGQDQLNTRFGVNVLQAVKR